MKALHARYPFLADARAAVKDADVDLATVVTEDGPIVERALERIRLAIEEGTVGEPRRPRVELLSYPVARVLVSLVDQPGLVHRYARAEADTARERFLEDVEADDALRSVATDRLDLETLLAEFDLDGTVRTPDRDVATTAAGATTAPGETGRVGVDVDVDMYLRLTAGLSEPRWRLPARSLAGGAVAVSREELYDLLREAIRERIESDLPLSVPEPVSGPLEPSVTELEATLADLDHDWDIDAVDPELFPPCVTALLDRVDAGDPLPDHSRFTLVSFLATVGMDTDEIVARLESHDDIDAGRLETRLDHLRADGGDAMYPPPSCETMVAYGDCVNTDDLCERVAHPLEYYSRCLDSQ